MERRQFLQASVICLLSGKVLVDTLSKYQDKKNHWMIQNDLARHVRLAKYTGETKEGQKQETKGYGIILDGRYITMAHIPDGLENRMVMTPFWAFPNHVDIINKKSSLEGRTIEEVYFNKEEDIAIYEILIGNSEKEKIPDFPCKPNIKYEVGDEVYLIGNPRLSGTNIRKGYISDIDLFRGQELTKNCFGTNIKLLGGDSGTPLVNKDFELLGLAGLSVWDTFGYIKKIEKFLDNLNGKVRRRIKE